jgi:two-component sensor histidine kinase
MADPKLIDISSAHTDEQRIAAMLRDLQAELGVMKAKLHELLVEREVHAAAYATSLADVHRQIKSVRTIGGRASRAADRIENSIAELRVLYRQQRG